MGNFLSSSRRIMGVAKIKHTCKSWGVLGGTLIIGGIAYHFESIPNVIVTSLVTFIVS